MLNWIKQNKILTLLTLFLLVASFYAVYKQIDNYNPQSKKPKHLVVRKKGEDMKEETTNEKNYRKAKLKLEHPYSPVKEDIRASALPIVESALSTIQKSKKVTDTTGTYDNHLSMTDNPMIQTVAIAMLINHYTYQADRIEILESDSDDVVQVLIPLTKQGADNVCFVANYNLTVQQLQIADYVGGPIGGTFG